MDQKIQIALNRIKEANDEKAERLSLMGLGLAEIPMGVFELKNLKELNLSSNRLSMIPESISKLNNLSRLDLRGNQLSIFPESITKLIALRELFLSSNQLSVIPKSIIKLGKLRLLFLSSNQFTVLPKDITNLNSLSWLKLSSNQLSIIPESIVKLSNLRELDLMDNPIENPPLEVVNMGVRAIKEYLERQKKEGTSKIYEAKIVVVGAGGVGKTSLSQKILNSDYELLPESKDISTEGISILPYGFKGNGGQDFQVNLWDFGGQEIYHATHQFFLTKRSLYLLVTDSRKEDTDLNYWLNVQQLLAGDSPVFIIQNEKQNRVRELNKSEVRENFENVRAFFPTNLGDNRGLESIIKRIQSEVQCLPHIGNELPKSWAAIRKELEVLGANYISLKQYFDICKKYNISEPKKALILSEYLHDIGVMLHFQDNPILERMIILNNEWGTDAVYKVIDYPKVIKQKGRFTFADLKDIWYSSKYAGKHLELVTLMEKFKLCYKVADTDLYITPARLPVEKVAYVWEEHENIQFRYMYKFMPKGILTRFIVEMHRYIKDQEVVWNTGVVLEKNATLAEVREVYGENIIKVRIKGKHPDRLRILIMEWLDRINDSFTNLRVEKLIPCNCERCAGHIQPHFYTDDRLLVYKEHRKFEIECPEPPFNKVDVRKLLHDFAVGQDLNKRVRKSKYPKILISYNHKDTPFVDYLEPYLNANGIDFWRDVHNAPAGRLDKTIRREMEDRVVLLIFSKNSVQSDWVEYEIQNARNLEKEQDRDVMCPITIDDAWQLAKWSPILMNQIHRYHVMDFAKWEDKGFMERQFDRLLEGLERNYKNENYD